MLRVLRVLLRARYFHNWSGNRVTCRDWFQLTLKEGFTVYRDQHFTSDMTSAAVKRIEDARIIRSAQFTQDAGMPTRASNQTIDNQTIDRQTRLPRPGHGPCLLE